MEFGWRGAWQDSWGRGPFTSFAPQNLKKDIRGVLDQMEDIQLEILG